MNRAFVCAAVGSMALLGGCEVEPGAASDPISAERDGQAARALTPAGPTDITDSPCPASGSGERIRRLSEEMAGACNDAAALQSLLFEMGPNGRLIVDKVCTLDAGIRLPNPFALVGVSDGGEGALVFTHDGTAVSVCQNAPRQNVTVEDLAIYGPYSQGTTATHSTGIALANLNMVHLNRVRGTDFYVGVRGTSSYSVDIQSSNISANRQDNIVIGYNANGWRIRDGLSSGAARYGINVLGPGDARPIENVDGQGHDAVTSNDLLIDGVRMESNGYAAIRTAAYSTRIINNRFEGNGAAAGLGFDPAVVVTNQAVMTRVLTNLFGSTAADCILNQGASTQMSLNMPAAIGCL